MPDAARESAWHEAQWVLASLRGRIDWLRQAYTHAPAEVVIEVDHLLGATRAIEALMVELSGRERLIRRLLERRASRSRSRSARAPQTRSVDRGPEISE